MSKLVKAPLVIAKAEDGRDVYLYEGAAFPDGGLAEGEAERLADFLEESEPEKPARSSSKSSK